jgi:hypothetical protein
MTFELVFIKNASYAEIDFKEERREAAIVYLGNMKNKLDLKETNT